MGAIRIVVDDVDAAIAAFAAAGYAVAERWGPPFAVLAREDGPDLWVSGPGTSAVHAGAGLSTEDARCAAVRTVVEVADVTERVQRLVAAGWIEAGEVIAGVGGSQQLVRRGPVFLEVFAAE